MKIFGMLLAVMLALAGAAPDTPVRHLEYAFASYPTAVPNGGYYNGTLRVDILGTAPDGGTLVDERMVVLRTAATASGRVRTLPERVREL
jgi:hypothetical protein